MTPPPTEQKSSSKRARGQARRAAKRAADRKPTTQSAAEVGLPDAETAAEVVEAISVALEVGAKNTGAHMPEAVVDDEQIARELPDDASVAELIRDAEQVIHEARPDTSASFMHYLHEMQRYPVLDKEREYQFAKLAYNGNAEAADALVRHNLRLVISVARRYLSHGVPIEDLVQEGNIGLMKAVRRFDPDRGVKFASYGLWWIQQGIRAAVAAQKRVVNLPIYRATQVSKITRATELLTKALGRTPTSAEISAVTVIPLGTVEALRRISQGQVSLDAPLTNGCGNEVGTPLAERIGSDASSAESLADRSCRDELIAECLSQLRPRDAQVLRMVFGIGMSREHTLEEIGKVLGITRERVRQLRDRALRAFRELDRAGALKDYWGAEFSDG